VDRPIATAVIHRCRWSRYGRDELAAIAAHFLAFPNSVLNFSPYFSSDSPLSGFHGRLTRIEIDGFSNQQLQCFAKQALARRAKR